MKKLIKISGLIFAVIFSNVIVYASDVSNGDNATESTPGNNITIENYCLITDEATGQVERIDLDSEAPIVRDIGGTVYVTERASMDTIPVFYAGQTGTDTINGWKGTVSITYTDNGTRACLTHVNGNWTKVSGSAGLSNAKVSYGQALGTNSQNGSTPFGSTCSIETGFAPGKYGYGQNHFLGANISANIGGKIGTVVSNIYF